MRQVLLVEPNEQVVEGYRRLLRVFSASWSVRFAPDVDEALKLLEQGGLEVLILDSRTKGRDNLLLDVRTKYPRVTRVVLAGPELRSDESVQLALLAHQLVKKPFIPPQLFELIERTCMVASSLENDRLAVVMGQLGALPALPQTYSTLAEMTANPDVSLDAMSEVIERDVATSAAVLRIINSAFFGLPRRISSVRETVRFLGIQPIKNIVLTVEIFEGLASGRVAQNMQYEAIARACAMRELLGRTPLAEAGFAAGVLADLGNLMLASRLPIDAAAIARKVDGGQLPWAAEVERLGCTHAEIGAALLSRWNLPNQMVEAVAMHHRPFEGTPLPSVASALALVTAVEYSHRCHDALRSEFRATAERLATAFPTANLATLDRFFARTDESVA